MAVERVHVAAGVIRDGQGRVLIARRPRHLHQGGRWEFPGGKCEPGETAYRALVRELHEELHIDVEVARPLIRLPYDYPDKAVLLDVWAVERFRGEAVGGEGQPIRWVAPDELPGYVFPAANGPIVTAARLPELYLITGDFADVADFERRLVRALTNGVELVQLRAPALADDAYQSLALHALALCRSHGARLLLNAAPELVSRLGADGVHLNGSRLRGYSKRPLSPEHWVGASVHDADELALAQRLGADFVVAGPVLATASHPGARTLHWGGLRAVTELASQPVYALGGLGPEHLVSAHEHGAQGVAAIRALWGAESD